MLKQVFLARFEPVLTEFSPFHHMYAPLCALRPYLRAVWWSHLQLGEGCRLEDIYIYIYIYIYYYTPLPLNLANKQQQASNNKQATTTSTSPHRFGHCSASSLRALLYSSHLAAQVVALTNPNFEPKTHRWRPGAGVPSREVPSQICAVLGQKQRFFAQNGPKTRAKRPNEGIR